MMKKIALMTLVSFTCLTATPHNAKASIPFTEISLGVEIAGEVLKIAEPLVKGAVKIVERGGKFLITYVQKKRAHARKEEEFFIKMSYRGLSTPRKQENFEEDALAG